VASKSEQLARVLVAEHNRLGAYVLSITGDFHICEDVLQDVALVALEKVQEVSDDVSLRVWIRRIARFKALAAMRRKRRRDALLSEEVLDKLESLWESHDQQHACSEASILEMLRACVNELMPNQRRLLSLRYAKGLCGADIAARLKVNVNSVYQAITRVQHKLAECVKRKKLSAEEQAIRDD
jgi:RNA polymerase sigma-70 factor, ECF subfamily